MSGHLILVSGIAGAGKSTLTKQALVLLPTLDYLTTYTTRPPRPLEQDGNEYHFIDRQTYTRLQAASTHWDHTDYGDHWYGTDVAAVGRQLAQHDVICAVAPVPEIIAMMHRNYSGAVHLIWIDIPRTLAAKRIGHDYDRATRPEDMGLAAQADIIFTPTGQIALDGPAFAACLSELGI